MAQHDKIYWDDQNDKITDDDFRKSRFGYEQILPLSIPDTVADRLMGEDLNRYFGLNYQITGQIEQKEIECYLIQLSKHSNVPESTGFARSFKKSAEKDKAGRAQMEMKGGTINETMHNYFQSRPTFFKETDLIINSTGFEKRIDLLLPLAPSLKSFQELQEIFEQNGLTITKQRMKVNMLVIKDL